MKPVQSAPIRNTPYLCITISFLMLGLAFASALVLQQSTADGLLSNTQNVIYNTLACLAFIFAASKTRSRGGATAPAWFFLAAAQTVYLAGDVLFLVQAGSPGSANYPTPPDFLYLAYYPLFLVAVSRFPGQAQERFEKIQALFQIAIVVTATGLFTWYFMVAPLIDQASPTPLKMVYVAALPALGLLLVLAILLLIFRLPEAESPAPLFLLICGASLIAAADFSYTYLVISGVSPTDEVINLAYQISYTLFIIAGISQGLRGGQPLNPIWQRAYLYARRLLRAATPSFWLMAVFFLLVNSHQPNDTHLYREVASWTGAIIALAIVFQLLLAKENQRLTDNLTAANAELEARVQARTNELAQVNAALSLEVQERRLASEALALSREQYRTVVEDLPVMIARFLPDSSIVFANTAYCRSLDLSAEELIGLPFLQLIPAADRPRVEAHFLSLTPENPVSVIEHRIMAPDGSVRWQRWIDRALFADGKVIEYQSIGEDITERRLADDALRESEGKFRDLFDGSSDLIQIIAPDGHIIFTNNAWRAALGYNSNELHHLLFWDMLDPACRASCQNHFSGVLTGRPLDNLEAVLVTRSGERLTVEGNISCAMDAGGRPLHIRAILHDITHRKKAEALLMRQAYTDALTGLPNRTMFIQRLSQVIASRPGAIDDCAVLFLDLDNFKYINDSLGHSAGDQLLINIGARLLTSVRSQDLVARLGGDEFVFLLEHFTDPSYAIQAAERVLEILRAPATIFDHLLSVSGSIGVVLGDCIHDVEGALRDADIAMYQAKNLGKNRHFVFEPALRGAPLEHKRIENELRRALENDELRLVYQPLLSLVDQSLAGFEALLRWQHPERGLLKPADFLPLAEETGLIVPIGGWALRQACRQMRRWQEGSPLTLPLSMNVNMSARQLADPGLIDLVSDALAESGLPPTCLALELAENTILVDPERQSHILHELTALGVSICLDNFGAGYTSLSRLQDLPIIAIKIDRAFIDDLAPNGDNLEIVSALNALGKELRLGVIAEGVEQQFHLTHLAGIGCTLGQGFYFSEPVPAEAIEEMYLN